MYTYYHELQMQRKRTRENYANIDLGSATNNIIQLLNSLNLSNEVIGPVANNPASFTNQAVSFEGGTVIDTSGNIIVGPTPSQPNHAITSAYLANYMYPGSNVMNSLLSDTVTTMVLDMNNYATNTFVQNTIADAAFPIANTSSIYGGGWRYVNNVSQYPGTTNVTTSVSNKINWYFFTNTQNNAGYAYGRMNTAFIRLQFALSSTTTNGNCPYLVVYTLPQSSGGNGGSWFRSKKCYSNTSATPLVNTDVILYVGADPRMCGFPNLNATQYVQLTYTNSGVTYTGPSGQTDIQSSEVISLLGWDTNSSSPTGTVDFTCVEMGYSIGSSLYKVITFM